MKKITIIFILSVAFISLKAQHFMVTYTFDSVQTNSGTTDPSFLPVFPHVVCDSFRAVGTPPNPAAGTTARFNYAGWSLGSNGGAGDTLYSGMFGALADTEYYEVTIGPASGYLMTYDTIR